MASLLLGAPLLATSNNAAIADSLLSSYVLYSPTGNLALTPSVKVLSGGIGSKTGSILVGTGCLVSGANAFAKAPSLNILPTATVTSATITGSAVVTLPTFLNNPHGPFKPNLIVPANSTITVSDSIFNFVLVGDNSSITFTAKNIYAQNISLGDNVNTEFTTCGTNVIAVNKITIGRGNNFNTVNTKAVTLYLPQNLQILDGAKIRVNAHIKGSFIASGSITNPIDAAGTFIGGLISAHYTTFNIENLTCTTPPQNCGDFYQDLAGDENLLSSYTIYSPNPNISNVTFSPSGKVLSGGVGAKKSFILVGTGSEISGPGSFVKGTSVNVLPSAVGAGTPIIGSAVVPLPAYLSNTYGSFKPNLIVPANSTITVSDSIFNFVLVGNNSSITFTAKNIYAQNISLGDDVNVQFATCSNIRAVNKVTIGKNNQFNTTNTKSVVIYLDQSFQIFAGAQVRASTYVKGTLITSGSASERINAKGLFIANAVSARFTDFNADDICNVCDNNIGVNYSSVVGAVDNANTSVVNASPNPFNSTSTIRFNSVTDEDNVSIKVYNINGAEVANLYEGSTKAGDVTTLVFDGANLNSGIYFVKTLTSSGLVNVEKLLLIK